MGVVDNAVEDGIGERGVADDLVPVVDRHLAGDDQRAGVVAVLNDLQQVAALLGGQRFRPPVIEDQQIDLGKLPHEPGVAAVTARQGQCRKQPRAALVKDRQVIAACLVAQRAGQPRLPGSAFARDQTMPMLADPVATGQSQKQRSVETPLRAEVNVLDGGSVPQFGGAGAGLEALLLPQRGFAFDQQAEPLGMSSDTRTWTLCDT